MLKVAFSRNASHRFLMKGMNLSNQGKILSQQITVVGGCTEPVAVRFFSVLSKEEEDEEKKRVEGLSKYQKEIELRALDKELARLNTLRGINTGELYTFRGKFKALARDYGVAFMAWVSLPFGETSVLNVLKG
jgi:hypothetical protein